MTPDTCPACGADIEIHGAIDDMGYPARAITNSYRPLSPARMLPEGVERCEVCGAERA